jgi:LDH2 family malate/lactate/ureidoglycolate dehydrogenase
VFGVKGTDAAIVSECPVDADIRGIPSHGASRLPAYISAVGRGFNNSGVTLSDTLLRETPLQFDLRLEI